MAATRILDLSVEQILEFNMLYCKTENGAIDPPAPLPTNYANVSGFHLMDENIVNSYGFYRYVATPKPEYNSLTHKLVEDLILENGEVRPVFSLEPLTSEEIQGKLNEVKLYFVAIVENFLDSTVQAKDYKNILHACSYANSTVEQYRNEAGVILAWRDAVWIKAYEIQNAILSGQRAVPLEQEFLDELPELEWPE